MTAPNHIVGGLAITGIFGSFSGLNIFSDATILVTTLIGTLLPDIDHTRSGIGKLVYPLAWWINRHYGHRTITHSLLALVFFLLLVKGCMFFLGGPPLLARAFGIAYASHLLLDMMTIQGVSLFYPFFRNPCVLPGNPRLRFRTANLRSEAVLFCVFSSPFCSNSRSLQ